MMKKFIVLSALFFSPAPAAFGATDAEIVMLVGKGEKRDSESAPWISAALKQLIRPGGFAKTLANSQMGLLLPDRTQMRLNQNSQLQIKSVVDSGAWTETTVRLNAGRAWSQARPQTGPGAGAPPAGQGKLSMETPSATMSIRGTDWEVEVLPDGATQLVVLSGTVEMQNDHGALRVERGESALAAPGKAPVKIQLINPKQRVQWVSYWKAQPERWGGTDADAAARRDADERMSQGEVAAAISLLETRMRDETSQPLTTALLARMLARDERVTEARKMVAAALAHQPTHLELLLAAGDLAVLDGDAVAARGFFTEALAREPELAEAWYGIGLINSERENVGAARLALDRALKSAPDPGRPVHGAAQSERAMVETFAGNLREAQQRFDAVVAADPENYAALTALGLNLLKSGRPQAALEAFLKAGTIEPRYARAWLYSGAAFYQLDEPSRALEAFARAAELDPKDPLPHLMSSLVLTDALDFGKSIDAARRAQARMPYLKSLNQIANDQKGSANLGIGLANFGLQEWATFYATEAYSPFWAGSHLFLADRYTGQFAKNSELFKGFLTDPTVFGASNRRSSLISAPGHYGKLEVFLERATWKQNALIATANGQSVEPVPMAYFVSGDLSTSLSRDDPSSARGTNVTIGLGAKPQHDIGVFAFITNTDLSAGLRSPSLADDKLNIKELRADLGFNFKLRPDNQLWFKAGNGRQDASMAGAFVSQALATSLNTAFSTTIFKAAGKLDRYQTQSDQNEWQFRHSIGSAGSDDQIITWGVEQSRFSRPINLTFTFAPVRLAFSQQQTMRSTDMYLSGKWRLPGGFSAQADLWRQKGNINGRDLSTLDLITTPKLDFILQDIAREQKYAEFNPRLGVTWRLAPLQSVRLVSQRWRRPAGVSTLGPIDTEGIPVNERLPLAGGLYSRNRLQFDQEFGGRWYAQAFVDHERIDNGIRGITSLVPELQVGQLDTLRNNREVFTPVSDLEETAQFTQGIVDTLGLTGNFLVSQKHTFSARYLHRAQHLIGANRALQIPYVPRHMLRLASQWSLPDRWLLGVNATYRSARFRDAANRQRLNEGVAFGMTVYWESADKRSTVQGILDNLLTDKAGGIDNKSHLTIRYAYKF